MRNAIRWRSLLAICSLFLIGPGLSALGQTQKLTTAQAKDHIGEQATVCGRVVSSRYAARSRGKPTFLDLDKPYPNQAFTALIWGENRGKFGAPEKAYRGKTICVTGKIAEYRGSPEMVISDPSQLAIGAESSSQAAVAPAGATAECRDGTYSFSHTRRGTCSHHGGVARWLQ